MDAPRHLPRRGEVRRSHDDDAVAQRLERLTTSPVACPLRAVGLVVAPVVLDHDLPPRVQQVDASDEPTALVEDVDVHLRLRQTCEHQHEPQQRLHRRLRPLSHHGHGPARPRHAVQVLRVAERLEPLARARRRTQEVLGHLDERHQPETGAAVDEGALRPGDGDPRHGRAGDRVQTTVEHDPRQPRPERGPSGEVHVVTAGVVAPHPQGGQVTDDAVGRQHEQRRDDPDPPGEKDVGPHVDAAVQASEP